MKTKKIKLGLMFPGQGIQFVGMINDFIYDKQNFGLYSQVINEFDEAFEDCNVVMEHGLVKYKVNRTD